MALLNDDTGLTEALNRGDILAVKSVLEMKNFNLSSPMSECCPTESSHKRQEANSSVTFETIENSESTSCSTA